MTNAERVAYAREHSAAFIEAEKKKLSPNREIIMVNGQAKRTPGTVEQDLTVVTRLYCKGKSQAEIAAVLDVSRSTVRTDIEKIKARWRESSEMLLNEMKMRELDRIDTLEAECWVGYERSCKAMVKTSKKTTKGSKNALIEGGDVEEYGEVVEQGYGDPRFLQMVAVCIAKRCEILGLNEAQKVDATIKDERPVTRLTKEELESKIQKILEERSKGAFARVAGAGAGRTLPTN